jgi:glycerol-3-phosphate O-acyltransferase
MNYMALLQNLQKKGNIAPKDSAKLEEFYTTYSEAVRQNGLQMEAYEPLITKYLQFVIEETVNPYRFENYHQAIRKPFDFYRFGLDFFRPLIRMEKSEVRYPERILEIERHLAKGENVILLANHQVEPDPQIIGIMLEKQHPKLAEKMIFVAGHRVTTDPTAIPGSKGCNLLCIYSKKHIKNPPEDMLMKQQYNQRTMQRMNELLSEGGKCIYVAPSGGRDRRNPVTQQVEIAPFDPQSIEMFWLMARHSGKPTHFYPLSLSTYNILPPPEKVEVEVGERRIARCAPVTLAFGKEINMDHVPGTENLDKKSKRAVRANYIWQQVQNEL